MVGGRGGLCVCIARGAEVLLTGASVSLLCVFTERLTKCDSLPSNSSR